MRPWSVQLGELTVGDGAPCRVVADLSPGHRGDVERAVALVDAAADAGADAVLFDSCDAARADGRRGRDTGPAAPRWADLPVAAHAVVRDRARARGLTCIAAPRDAMRTAVVASLGIPALAVAAGDVTCVALLERVGRCGRPVLLGTEGASPAEIDAALAALARGAGAIGRRPPVVLVHGGSLADVDGLVARSGGAVGWRDTASDPTLAVAAVARGARLVVKPLTGAAEVGVAPDGLARLVAALRTVEAALARYPRPGRRRPAALAGVGPGAGRSGAGSRS